ncbi:MAG: nucleoside hydrolase [Clostridiaceae bacterium]|nr:nucleoside hydrolase [Clostridiaceae bacterium]
MLYSKSISDELLKKLDPPKGLVRMVLDTDTYNEVDDQFALSYALKSPEKLKVEAVYAAPFFNANSSGPADGMEKSYQEILKIFSLLKMDTAGKVFKGSTGYLRDAQTPQPSPAARDLVQRAMNGGPDPLYVVSIGAITNVASAILLEPAIIGKIVVVWLGGHALNWPDTREFNLEQDPPASRIILDCGVPLIQFPCMGVTTHLATTVAELDAFLAHRSDIGTYLTDIVRSCSNTSAAWSRVIWDAVTIGWLINPDWVPTQIVPSPILTDQITWGFDSDRHPIRSATFVQRDAIFTDLFRKLTAPESPV